MNRKVFVSMLTLCVIFLCGLYIAKIFFPQQFVMSIENENLIKIGLFIDNNIYATCIMGIILGCIFDYLYFGAVCRKVKLSLKLIIIIIAYNIGFTLFYNLVNPEIIIENSNIISGISSCYMILLPMFFTNDIKGLSITYTINYISQALSLSIRNLSLLLTSSTSITILLMTIETYLWVGLCYMVFNYDKRR